MQKKQFLRGLRSGVSIGLGYLSVSFTFGIMAISCGLYPWQALLISMTTLTSAGQLAGINVMASLGSYAEMLISQLTINVRYSFMSVSLSQKADKKFGTLSRAVLGFFMTDEIFAVASGEKEVTRSFFAGLAVMPYLGWTGGTLLGAYIGDILPGDVMSALCLAIYGMFIAIVVPAAKKEKPILLLIAIAAALSCAFEYLPVLSAVPDGLAVSVVSVIAAVIGAWAFSVGGECDG